LALRLGFWPLLEALGGLDLYSACAYLRMKLEGDWKQDGYIVIR